MLGIPLPSGGWGTWGRVLLAVWSAGYADTLTKIKSSTFSHRRKGNAGGSGAGTGWEEEGEESRMKGWSQAGSDRGTWETMDHFQNDAMKLFP